MSERCPTCMQEAPGGVLGLQGPEGLVIRFCDRPLCFQVAVLQGQVEALQQILETLTAAMPQGASKR